MIELVSQALGERGVMDRDTLKTEVEAQLSATGRSRQGFALRFHEALKDEAFIETEQGFQLRTTAEPTDTSPRVSAMNSFDA